MLIHNNNTFDDNICSLHIYVIHGSRCFLLKWGFLQSFHKTDLGFMCTTAFCGASAVSIRILRGFWWMLLGRLWRSPWRTAWGSVRYPPTTPSPPGLLPNLNETDQWKTESDELRHRSISHTSAGNSKICLCTTSFNTFAWLTKMNK